MAKEAEESKRVVFHAKDINKRGNETKRKFKWRDRVELEMLVDDIRHDGSVRRPKGKRFTAHRLMAEQLVIDKIAKTVVKN